MDKAHSGNIIVSPKRDMPIPRGFDPNLIPLRIKCPDCGRIYLVFIENFDQGLWTILGKAVCPYCKRFIKESDDPDNIIMDAKEIREALEGGQNGRKRR